MTADLGARKIREELDALMVLGVDPIKSLVVPRFLSLMLLTPLFSIYALLFGTLGGVLVTLSNGAQVGPFFSTFFAQASTAEFEAMLVKSTLFGAMIAIVCCYKGLTASGRRRGGGARGQPGGGDRVPGDRRDRLRVHADAAGHPPGPQHAAMKAWPGEPARQTARRPDRVRRGVAVLRPDRDRASTTAGS